MVVWLLSSLLFCVMVDYLEFAAVVWYLLFGVWCLRADLLVVGISLIVLVVYVWVWCVLLVPYVVAYDFVGCFGVAYCLCWWFWVVCWQCLLVWLVLVLWSFRLQVVGALVFVYLLWMLVWACVVTYF